MNTGQAPLIILNPDPKADFRFAAELGPSSRPLPRDPAAVHSWLCRFHLPMRCARLQQPPGLGDWHPSHALLWNRVPLRAICLAS